MRLRTLFLIAFVLPLPLLANAWPRGKGHGFLSTTYWSYSTANYWDRNGNERNAHNVFKKQQSNVYYEVGLSEKHTFSLQALYDKITESAHGTTIGFEDPEFALRALLQKRKHHLLSAEVLTIIPAGSNRHKTSLRYGKYGLQGSILWGCGFKFHGQDAYYDLRVGYRHYWGFPSDQIRTNFSIGSNVGKKVQLFGELNLEYGLFNGKKQLFENVISQDPNYRLLKLSLNARYRISDHISLVAGYYRHIWGQNCGTGGGFILGTWFEY